MATNARDLKKPHISVTGPAISGYFAVMYWYNPGENDNEGFWEPWDSGIGRYATKEEAIVEAKQWADDEGMEYIE